MDNTINSLVSQAVGVTDQQIRDFLATNPNQQQLAAAMQTYGVAPEQVFNAAGVGQGQTLNVGGTIYQPEYQTTGSGMDQQVGPLSNIYSYQADQNKVGGAYNQYDPTGQFQQAGTQQKVDTSLGGAIKQMAQNPGFQIAALAYGGNALMDALGGTGAGSAFELQNAGAGAFGGETALNTLASMTPAELAAFEAQNAGASAMTGGSSLATIGAGGKTAAELAALDLATGGAGGTAGAEAFANATATGANVPTLTNLTGGSGVLTGAAANITADSVAKKLAADALLNPTTVVPPVTTPKTIIDPTTGLITKAVADAAGSIANQQGITDARNLINQYGGIANNQLNTSYQNAQNLNAANRTDLGNVYTNLNKNLNNTLNAQAGLYGQTNTNLANNYANTLGNMQNLYSQQVGYQNSYQDIGRAGSQGLLANQDYLQHQFDANDLNTNLAPNYAFQLQQGQMANQRAGNMGGGALGGNALQGLQRYTQDYAGGAYQNAFNNYNTQRNNIYNSLAGMANIGTTSAGQLAGLGNTYGSNLGSLSSNYGGNMLSNAGQLQGAYNQYGSNLTGAANTYGGNLTSSYGQGINAANAYGLNSANLATGLGSALASNATQTGANNATALNNIGNAALYGSVIKPT